MKKTTALLLTSALLAGGIGVATADDDRYERGEGSKFGCRHKGEHGGYGHHGWGRHGHDAEERVERMSKVYGLNDKQVEQVRAITKKYEAGFDKLQTGMRDNRTKLRELMEKGDAGEADVRKLADAHGRLKADKIVLRSKMQQEIDKVLTKEQLEKRKQWREARRKDS
jgi:Spy/CpxP family protein refolding chaperone